MNPQTNNSSSMSLWMVWGGMLFSIVIYFVVLSTLGDSANSAQPDPEFAASLGYVFGAISFALLAVIFVIRQVLFHKPLAAGKFESLDELRPAYFTASIASWALAEAIAILGFVLSFLSNNLDYYLAFAPVGVLAMLLTRPQPRRFEQAFTQQTPDTGSQGAEEADEMKATDNW